MPRYLVKEKLYRGSTMYHPGQVLVVDDWGKRKTKDGVVDLKPSKAVELIEEPAPPAKALPAAGKPPAKPFGKDSL